MRIALIPARGGSKRIPRKNIREFCGKPMIAWSIEAALGSECFDQVIVSTEDSEIAEVARAFGAQTPFVRPQDLADDYTGTIPVVAHGLQWALKHLGAVSHACCIYATAPFVRPGDLQTGWTVLNKNAADYAFSVTRYPFPIQRALQITDAQRVRMFDPSQFNTRSQDLEEAFHDAGQFYWGTAQAWRSGQPIFSDRSAPVVLPRYRVQDIDTEEDWRHAELLFQALLMSKGGST